MRFLLVFVLVPQLAWAESRIATWNADLSRKGPGLLLRDIEAMRPDIVAARATIAVLDADILLLTDVDYDHDLVALRALDLGYPHLFALLPNTGMQTGVDRDGDGQIGGPRDGQGFGFFSGDGGMAVLSRFPIGAVRDFSAFLWRDLPAAPDRVPEDQRLSTTAHWDVEILTPDGPLHLLAWHATPPLYEDRNIVRNEAEAAFWSLLLDGALPFAPPPEPFVVIGGANGESGAIASLRARLQDVHDTDRARLDYLLPSNGISVRAAGMMATEARHNPIWAELGL